MARNAAIILSISEYDHEESLPSCRNDHSLVCNIIKETEKYKLILELSGYQHSSQALERICESIDQWRSEVIDEVLFYYSGHGILGDGQFLFPFSNYHSTNKNATSLSNSRLDDLLRGLSPSNAVKIVDACYSGAQYIKGESSIQDAMRSSESSFNSLYFFYSSTKSQVSYAGDAYGNFTHSIAKSLLSHEGKKIRYHDIISFIRDEELRPKQHPFYVTQGPATEVFCEVTTSLADLIRESLAGNNTESPIDIDSASDDEEIADTTIASVKDSVQHKSDVLIRRLEQVSLEYQTKDHAIKALSDVEDMLRSYQFDPLIHKCYAHELRINQSVPDLPSLRKVAEWIQRFGEEYFVQIEYKNEEYEAHEKVEYVEEASEFYKSVMPIGSMLKPIKKRIRTEPVSKTRMIAAGYTLPQGIPFSCLHLILTPLLKALPGQDLYILPILSSRKMRLFYKQENRKRIDFDQDECCDVNDWAGSEALLMRKGDVENVVKNAISQLENRVIEEIRAIAQS